MEYVFYLDLFFLTDCFFNALSLFLAASLGRCPVRIGRLLLAAAAGSAFACAWFMLPAPFPGGAAVLFLFVQAGLMAVLAFPVSTPASFFRMEGLFFLSAVLVGGGAFFLKETAAFSGPALFVLLFSAALGAGRFIRGHVRERARGEERYEVTVCVHGRKKCFRALADSGNRLREPVTGKPVAVAASEHFGELIDPSRGVILIPYRAVGTGAGMLPGVVCEQMEIRGNGRLFRIEKPIVAVSREPLSASGDFSMLLPEEFIL